jgi:hypothetical protein
VTRSFPDGLRIPQNADGLATTAKVATVNAEADVSWVHSYVSMDRRKTFCVYDGPSPDAIRQVAERNGLPVDDIVEVRVLDPYFYTEQ